jgi:hypothetical protein
MEVHFSISEGLAMVIEVSTGTAWLWLVVSFVLTAGGISYCVSYLNRGDNS